MCVISTNVCDFHPKGLISRLPQFEKTDFCKDFPKDFRAKVSFIAFGKCDFSADGVDFPFCFSII